MFKAVAFIALCLVIWLFKAEYESRVYVTIALIGALVYLGLNRHKR